MMFFNKKTQNKVCGLVQFIGLIIHYSPASSLGKTTHPVLNVDW